METTAYHIAQTFLGVKDKVGAEDNPEIVGFLKRGAASIDDDETPWCAAFVNYVALMLRLPRPPGLVLRARSWLGAGLVVALSDAQTGQDIVILKRGGGNQPGPDVINAPGHVGFYAGHDEDVVYVLGGNQSNKVSIANYDISRVLGIRRLHG